MNASNPTTIAVLTSGRPMRGNSRSTMFITANSFALTVLEVDDTDRLAHRSRQSDTTPLIAIEATKPETTITAHSRSGLT
jgi:hypothetical protein